MRTLRGRDFLTLHDFTPQEVAALLRSAHMFKTRRAAGCDDRPLQGKTLAMIFFKSSTRTRVSFEVAMLQLGGHALYLSASDLQLKRGETVADTARVLSRYVDGIVVRTYDHEELEELARWATVPVINGLTDSLHPCQALGDLLTIQEHKGRLADLQLAYVGDGNNMAHSLMFAGAKTGMHVTIACAEGCDPDPRLVQMAQEDARATGARIRVTRDPRQAVEGADVVYTDVWTSMGQEAHTERKRHVLRDYQVNADLMRKAQPDAIFLHCLPAHRDEEVTDEVLEGPQSVVWEQAENRLHVQKAILAALL